MAKDPVESGDLGFSPGGSAGESTEVAYLNREVNVLVFGAEGSEGVLGSAELQDEEHGLKVVASPEGADRGWGKLTIQPKNTAPGIWTNSAETVADDVAVDPNAQGDSNRDGYGTFRPVAEAGNTMAVGFAVWERSFADQAGNYSRMVEHSTVTTSR